MMVHYRPKYPSSKSTALLDINCHPEPRRRSLRLKGYDYTVAGAYFVTICTYERERLLGEITDGIVRLNGLGETVRDCWENLPMHYPHVTLDAFVVMPNHIHGIVMLTSDASDVGAGLKPAPTEPSKRHGLPEIIRGFKTFSARRINAMRNTLGVPMWQRNYYEHVIRGDHDLNQIREYILHNPARWSEDEDNPENPAFYRRGGFQTRPYGHIYNGSW